MSDVNTYLNPAEKKMKEAVAYLEDALAHIRAGKANVRILDDVKVNAYGQKMPISGVANIATPDARSITITPWDRNNIRAIEKAIMDSNVGITPENNGEVIRLNIITDNSLSSPSRFLTFIAFTIRIISTTKYLPYSSNYWII